jgi:DNA-binding transcriptional ArsR family regulator
MAEKRTVLTSGRFSIVIAFPTMGTSKSDVILHPQRLRLILALAGGVLTTKQLAVLVPDIPQASLYRHLSTLLEAGVVEVGAERSVRGIVERSYSLVEGSAVLSGEDLAKATRDDHLRYFSIFATGLIAQFSRYLERESIDLEADGVGYREMVLQLTDDEFAKLLTSLSSVVLPAAMNEAGSGRTPRLFATVFLPLEPTPEAVV